MSDRLRPTGLEIIGDVAWGTHFCQFYRTAQDLQDILVPYFKAGLENNEFCMWIVSEPLGVEAARRAIAAAVPGFEEYWRKGQIEIIPHTDWYLKGGTFDADRVLAAWMAKLDAALAAGYDGLRLSGNTFWLEPKDWRAFTDYEAAIDNVIGRYRMLAACTYSVDRCGFDEILDVARNHRFALVRREGRWELVESAQSRRAYDELKGMAQFPEQNPNPVLRLTADGDILYANPPALAYLNNLEWEENAPAPEALARIAREAYDRTGALQTEIKNRLGQTHWVAAARPAGANYVNLYFRDITARKAAEVALRESEEKYRLLFQNMGEGFALYELVFDDEGRPVDWRVLEVNDAYTLHTGLARDQIVGQRVGEIFPAIVPDYLPIYARVVATQSPESYETFAQAVGRYQRVFAFPAGGRRFAATIVDISERKRLEAELAKKSLELDALFNNTRACLVLFDAARPFTVLVHNRAYQELFGEPFRTVGMVGKNIFEYAPAAEAAGVAAVFDQAASTGQAVNLVDFPYDSNPPAKSWFDWHLTPVLEDGKVVALASLSIDVTARHLAEEALRQSQEQFRMVVENSRDGINLLDLKTGRYVFMSPAQTELTGFTQEEINNISAEEAYERIHPDDREISMQQQKLVAEGPESGMTVEYRWKVKSGDYRWFSDSRRAIRDDEGCALALVGVSRDITERKQAEEALRESAERLRSLYGSMTEGLASHTVVYAAGRAVDYTITDVNPAFEGITGLRREAAIGRKASELFGTGTAPYLDVYAQVAEGGPPVTFEIYFPPMDKHFLISVFSPKRGEFATVFSDISQRKNTELLRQALADQERLRLGAAVEQASDAVIMLDLDGTIRYVNAAFEAINRIGRDQAAGRSYFSLLSAGSPAETAVKEALAKGAIWHGQVTRPVPDGRPVELELAVSAVKDPSGALLGGLITEKDVTQENALQRQFRQAQKMDALGTMAGGITHDFNNILGTIVINTELALLDIEPSHPARAALPAVLQAAARGKELVKQIITFSRQKEWTKARLEIAPVVRDTMILLRSTLPKDLLIHETIDADCGMIMGDASQIHQIVVNLCQNAALAMQERGGTLDVKLEPVRVDAVLAARHPDLKPGRYVRLTVADSGCGMSSEVLERIFEPFFTTRGHGGGSGLGLPVVLGIVKSYDGAIIVYSEPGKGSVFNVYLPRIEGGAPAAEAVRPRRQAGAGERILLVEDEQGQRASLTRSLTKLGYRVAARASGRSALSLFRRDPEAFDIVITDQIMPGMSGLDLAAGILKARPALPVVLCTGFSEKVNGDSIKNAGIREYVMKPFTLQEISRVIARALGKGGDDQDPSGKGRGRSDAGA
jgi:PAS domain S-box-containing protein